MTNIIKIKSDTNQDVLLVAVHSLASMHLDDDTIHILLTHHDPKQSITFSSAEIANKKFEVARELWNLALNAP